MKHTLIIDRIDAFVVAASNTTAQASKEALISEQTYYLWRKEYGRS